MVNENFELGEKLKDIIDRVIGILPKDGYPTINSHFLNKNDEFKYLNEIIDSSS